jgi:PAS domain S-box-containing protein
MLSPRTWFGWDPALWAKIRQAWPALLVAAVYYLVGYFGIIAKVPPAGMPTIWPPAAILLAALLLTPRRLWWTYLLTVGPVHVYLFMKCLPTMPGTTLAAQFVGYAAQAALAAEMLRRLHDLPPRLNDLRSATRFMLVAALGVPLIATTFVVYLYTLTGWTGDYWLMWSQRLLASVVPTLTLTPLIVLAIREGADRARYTEFWRLVEFAALMLVMIAVAFAVFGWIAASREAVPALLYALLPLLLWAALRFELKGLCCCLVTIAFVSLFSAYHGRGPFLTLGRAENVLALQVFLVAISVPLILLAAVVEERRRTERALRESEQRYSMATAAGSSGVWDWRLPTGELYLDPVLKAMLGYADHEVGNTMDAWIRCLHPDDVTRVSAVMAAHLDGRTRLLDVEHRVLHKNGSVRWFLCRGITVEWANGMPTRVTGTDTDVTERKRAEHELRESGERVRVLAGRLITAQEEERRRIARDLHDDLNQKMAALSIEISSLRLQLPPSAEGVSEKLDLLQSRTSRLVEDIRELSHEIHPAAFEHTGLVPALTSMAAQLKRLEDVDVQLDLPGTPPEIPPNVAICIYRVAQESIRNVVRHSGIRCVHVALITDLCSVTLEVRDSGRGFDVHRARANGGLGLISIEERVRLLDGSVELESRPGAGTVLRVGIPFEAAQSSHSNEARIGQLV